jgi:hypothetical protein
MPAHGLGQRLAGPPPEQLADTRCPRVARRCELIAGSDQLSLHFLGAEKRLGLIFLMRLRHAASSWRSSWQAAGAIHAFWLSYVFTSFAAWGS